MYGCIHGQLLWGYAIYSTDLITDLFTGHWFLSYHDDIAIQENRSVVDW